MDYTTLALVLALAVAGGVWAVVLALYLPTLHACLFTLVAVSCFGASFARWEVGPFAASPDRVLLALLPVLMILKRLLTPQPRWQIDRCDLVLAGLLALLVFSVCTHPAPPRDHFRPSPSYLLIASFLAPAMLYWVARSGAAGAADVRLLCGFFVLFGLYLAVTAVAEVHKLTALVLPRYILAPRTSYPGRAVGPTLSAPVLGTWLTVAGVAAIVLAARAGRAVRWLVLAFLPLVAYAQFLTKTRSAWLGFVVAIPPALCASAARPQRRVVLLTVLAVGVVIALLFGDSIVNPERSEGQAEVAQSARQRLGLLQRSLALFIQRPVAGWGFRQFEHASRTHGGGGPFEWVSGEIAHDLSSHNLLLRFLVETGVTGTVLFVSLFGFWFTDARQAMVTGSGESPERARAILFLGALVAYWAEAMFHDVTFMMQENMLLFFLAGCLPARHPAVLAAPAPRARQAITPVVAARSLAPRGIG